MRGGIERQVAVANRRIAAARLTADQRTHTGAEFIEIERFDKVIVGAGVEPFDAIGDRVARGEDQHRRGVAFGAQRAQHLEPVAFGQAEIEQHQIVRLAGRRAERRFAVFHPVHCEAFTA